MLMTDVGDEMCGDNFEMLVTVLTIFVTNILYVLALTPGINIQKLSPTSICHQYLSSPKDQK